MQILNVCLYKIIIEDTYDVDKHMQPTFVIGLMRDGLEVVVAD